MTTVTQQGIRSHIAPMGRITTVIITILTLASCTPNQPDSNTIVYITKDGEKYHYAGCEYLRKSCIPISLKQAKLRQYQPCSICTVGAWEKMAHGFWEGVRFLCAALFMIGAYEAAYYVTTKYSALPTLILGTLAITGIAFLIAFVLVGQVTEETNDLLHPAEVVGEVYVPSNTRWGIFALWFTVLFIPTAVGIYMARNEYGAGEGY